MVGILFLLFLLLICLLVAAAWLIPYVLIPYGLLRAFFRSEWAPPALKQVVGWTLGVLALLGMGLLGWRWQQRTQVQAEAENWRCRPPLLLTAHQPGLRPFPLGRGTIELARYDAKRQLVVSGDLPIEGRLRASFSAGPGGASPYETNQVTVSTDAGAATQATGWSVYDPATRRVSGAFRCVLPSGRALSVTFPATSTVGQ